MPSAKFATFPRLDFYHGPLCLSPRRHPQPPCNPATVQRVFPPKHRLDARRFVDRLQWDSIGRRFGWICNPALLADFARKVECRLAPTSEGIVFCPSRLPISWLDTDLPVTFCANAPLAAMLNTRVLRGDRVWAALHHHCHRRRGPSAKESTATRCRQKSMQPHTRRSFAGHR